MVRIDSSIRGMENKTYASAIPGEGMAEGTSGGRLPGGHATDVA